MIGYLFRRYLQLTVFICVIASGLFTVFENNALAQITPDSTLPNNSRIKLDGNKSIIEGGTTRNGNLFHSFKEFSLTTGSEAHFNNSFGIENIISRVTGKSISNIDGLIKTNGNANLFLINPNGIVFGKNASLDIGGSFISSTAKSLKFADGTQFSAQALQTKPLLSISVPIGLQYGTNPGSILNKSQIVNSNGEVIGLQVKPGRTLGLIGSDVNIEGGYLTANGRVEVGSVGEGSFIGLSPTDNGWELGYEGVKNFQDVQLSQGAVVNANGEGGGDIQVQGRNVLLTDDSQIQAKTFGSKSGGNLTINTSEILELRGSSTSVSRNQLTTQTTGDGTAGDITLRTNILLVKDGAQVIASTFGAGKAGNLTIDAKDVQIIGESKDGQITSGLFASAQPNSTGDAGNLSIKTNTLLVKDGVRVVAGTFSAGNGGNLIIDAQDVQIIGESKDGQFPSSFSVSAQPNSTGNAGNLSIKTNILLVKDGAQIGAATFGGQGGNLTIDAQDIKLIGTNKDSQFGSGLFTAAQPNSTGNAGDLTIKTNNLLLESGGQVVTATFGTGNGGNFLLDAQNVQIIGRSTNNRFASSFSVSADLNSKGNAGDLTIKTNTLLLKDGAQVSSATLSAGNGGNLTIDAQDIKLIGINQNPQFNGGLFVSAQPNSTGNAGDLNLTTNRLLISDGAGISVQNLGKGAAGDLNIDAESVQINNGKLTANTRSNNGGNITLDITDLLLMGNGSEISTSAGTTQAGGDGGNITINTPNGFIVATPNQNNDITANAFEGNGGKIDINATNIFGIVPLSFEQLSNLRPNDLNPSELQTNNITAISQQNPNLSGTVDIDILNNDPNRNSINLPVETGEAELVAGCQPGMTKNQNRFVVTGRGGLPLNPRKVFSSNTPQVDWVTRSRRSKEHNRRIVVKKSTSTPKTIVEATDWFKNPKGEIVLVANASNTKLHSSQQILTSCNTHK